jgi:hypothetical protein
MTLDTVQPIRIPVYGQITLKASELIDSSTSIGRDLWFFSAEWQARETEADSDIAQGHFTSHDNMDDFISALDD